MDAKSSRDPPTNEQLCTYVCRCGLGLILPRTFTTKVRRLTATLGPAGIPPTWTSSAKCPYLVTALQGVPPTTFRELLRNSAGLTTTTQSPS